MGIGVGDNYTVANSEAESSCMFSHEISKFNYISKFIHHKIHIVLIGSIEAELIARINISICEQLCIRKLKTNQIRSISSKYMATFHSKQ